MNHKWNPFFKHEPSTYLNKLSFSNGNLFEKMGTHSPCILLIYYLIIMYESKYTLPLFKNLNDIYKYCDLYFYNNKIFTRIENFAKYYNSFYGKTYVFLCLLTTA